MIVAGSFNAMRSRAETSRCLGVVGGMGPWATLDLVQKILMLRPGGSDEDYVPLAIISDPRIPSRNDAIMKGDEGPVERALSERIDRAVAAGAAAILLPCNTAHHWHERLQAHADVPILHIADAAIAMLGERAPPPARIAVLGTPATLRSGFYQERLSRAGYVYEALPPDLVADHFMSAVEWVKRGRPEVARSALRPLLDQIEAQDVGVTLLACSELPIALAPELERSDRFIDTTLALARAGVDWFAVYASAHAGGTV